MVARSAFSFSYFFFLFFLKSPTFVVFVVVLVVALGRPLVVQAADALITVAIARALHFRKLLRLMPPVLYVLVFIVGGRCFDTYLRNGAEFGPVPTHRLRA